MAGTTLYSTDYSSIIDNGDGTVTKVMKYTTSTLREISFNALCKDVDSILHPLETIYHDDTVEIIYPKTQELFDAKISYEELFIQGIRLLTILEQLKIVHLDFRPENIGLINGRIVLRDFGNAYLLRSDTGYISYFRYPVEKIQAPEFISTSPDDNSRSLRSFIYLRRTFEPASVLEYKDVEIIQNLYGSQFDTRADVWSFGVWFHHYLFGVWPEGIFFQKERLLKNYGMIGSCLVNMLEPDYQLRSNASEIAVIFSISIPPVSLSFKNPEFKHRTLINYQFEDLIDKGYDNGEIISQYSDLLLFTQNTDSNDVVKNIAIYSSNDVLSEQDINMFKSVGNLFLSSFYERDNIRQVVNMVTSPPRTGSWTWYEQYSYILGKDDDEVKEEPSVNVGDGTVGEIVSYFEQYLDSLPGDEEEAEASGILGSESDEE